MNEEELTGTSLLCYFKSYTALYAASDLPEPKTVVNATAEANNAAAKAEAFKQYTRTMERQCSTKRMMSDDQFQQAHKAAVEAAMEAFDKSKKMGSAELSTKFKATLKDEIQDSHKFFLQVRPRRRSAHRGCQALALMLAPPPPSAEQPPQEHARRLQDAHGPDRVHGHRHHRRLVC